MPTTYDYVIIGAGIAGASLGYELQAYGQVLILEQESQAGYHATGRSAALFLETYGNATIRALTTASRGFYTNPPPGFANVPLLTPRGAIYLGRADELPALKTHLHNVQGLVHSARWLEADELMQRLPILTPGLWQAGVEEPEAQDLDVHAIHQGYLRGLRARGGEIITDAKVHAISRDDSRLVLTTERASYTTRTVINAAGAWADHVAKLAKIEPLGLVPKRRTGVIIDLPGGLDPSSWPHFGDISESFYAKPDGKKLFVSPCDETPDKARDARPDDYDVAVAMDRLQKATSLQITTLTNTLAGLRTFAPDRTPVVGYGAPGFFWLAGQGGYGIQTAPAMARAAAALVQGQGLPADLLALGIDAQSICPMRFLI